MAYRLNPQPLGSDPQTPGVLSDPALCAVIRRLKDQPTVTVPRLAYASLQRDAAVGQIVRRFLLRKAATRGGAGYLSGKIRKRGKQVPRRPAEGKEWITFAEAAWLLSYKVATVHDYSSRGAFDGFKRGKGRGVRLRRDRLMEWAERRSP